MATWMAEAFYKRDAAPVRFTGFTVRRIHLARFGMLSDPTVRGGSGGASSFLPSHDRPRSLVWNTLDHRGQGSTLHSIFAGRDEPYHGHRLALWQRYCLGSTHTEMRRLRQVQGVSCRGGTLLFQISSQLMAGPRLLHHCDKRLCDCREQRMASIVAAWLV